MRSEARLRSALAASSSARRGIRLPEKRVSYSWTKGIALPDEEQHTDKKGFLEALFCHIIWGLMPIYWKLVSGVPAFQVLAWRMVWAAVFVIALCVLVKRVRFLYLARDARALRTFFASGLIVSLNWGIYVWAVNSGHVLETSIGYYLCPLANIFCGIVVFKERLTPGQKLATALAAIGVAFFIAAHGGAIWISFALAITFSIYGTVKKRGGYPALPGMALESLLTGVIGVAILAIGAAFPAIWQFTPAMPSATAVSDPGPLAALLAGAGVLTAVPLLLFSAAANRVSMTILGFMQYIGPTLALLSAVFLFGEDFTFAHAVCFAFVWAGIAIASIEPLVRRARRDRAGSA